jgi:hypothetical protein
LELPQKEQEFLGRLLFRVMEARFDQLIASRPDVLRKMAEEALAEARNGETEPLDPDNL